MLREYLWNTFKSTGSIKAYIIYKELEKKNTILDQPKIAKEEIAASN